MLRIILGTRNIALKQNRGPALSNLYVSEERQTRNTLTRETWFEDEKDKAEPWKQEGQGWARRA